MRRIVILVLFCLTSSQTSAQWHIETFAGTRKAGYSGDGGAAKQAQLDQPFGIVRGKDGALYICDTNNHLIRRVDRKGIISTVAGTGKKGYSGDGGLATKAELNEPYEIRFDQHGNMFFVERLNHLVRRVDKKTKIISTIAGTGEAGFSGDDGAAKNAMLNQPHSIQFDAHGDLFICDILNHRIRRVAMKTGIISTFAGTGEKSATPDGAKISGTPLFGPRAIDFDKQGNLWLALREGNAIYKFDLKKGTIHHIAGTGKKGFSGNGGAANLAELSGPKGLSIATNGDVYFADTESHSIRMIDLRKGTVELIAGTGERGDGAESDPLKCKLARPHGVFVDRDSSVFIGDSESHRVRVLRRK